MRKTWRSPKLTVRILMVVIGLSGVALGVERLRQRSRDFAARAEHYARLRERPGLGLCSNAIRQMDAERLERFGEEIRLRVAYFATMARKYEEAARSPWLVLEPDPPAPDALSEAMAGLTSADDW